MIGRRILGDQYKIVDMYFRGGPLLKACEGWNEHTRASVPPANILGTYLNEIGEPKHVFFFSLHYR